MKKIFLLILILTIYTFSYSQEKVALVKQADKYFYIDEAGNDLKLPTSTNPSGTFVSIFPLPLGRL